MRIFIALRNFKVFLVFLKYVNTTYKLILRKTI